MARFLRIDDRLIHGQTIVAWCPVLSIKKIVALDDVSAKNPMLKSIMTMGVPKQYHTSIITKEEFRPLMDVPSVENELVILKSVSDLNLIQDCIGQFKEVVLGNLAKRDGATVNMQIATGIFYLSTEDIELLEKLSKNVQIYFQQLPTTTKVRWEDFYESKGRKSL